MLYSRLAAILLCSGTLIAVAACSDPGSVGADLGENNPSDGEPKDTTVVVSATDTLTTPSRTGIVSDDEPWRVLTGTVDDPIAGTIETTGYVDVDSSISDGSRGFAENVADDDLGAELRLSRSYVHGDTAQSVDVTLFALLDQADMDRAAADTQFPAESGAITTHSVSPTTESTVTISLADWIDDRKSNLSGDSFSDFHGFQLATTSGNAAVVGFEHGSAELRVTTPSDTIAFPVTQSFTNIERTAPPSVQTEPEDRRLLVDGIGTALTFDWADDSPLAALANTSDRLNRATLSIPVDASFGTVAAGSDFVRPEPSGYRILAITDGSSPDCNELNLVTRSLPNASACGLPTVLDQVPGEARATPEASFEVVSRWFNDDARPFAGFRVEIANRRTDTDNPSERATTRRGLPSTIPVAVRMPVPSTFDTEELPRVTLTRTPL